MKALSTVALSLQQDVITEEDIEIWIRAVVRSLSPVINSETKDVLLFAVKEHGFLGI